MSENREHIIFSRKGKIHSKDEFTRDGTYMDPMNALFALYNTVDLESQLNLYFTYTFKHPRTFRHLAGKFFHLIRGARKSKGDDEAPEKTVEIKPEIFASFSYKIISRDKYMAEQLRHNIKSAYSPFVSNGKLKIRSTEKFLGLTHNQAVNFFHVPTVANFVKGLDYCVYRKLPYPTNLPNAKNTQANDLTILGLTDYRGEKITF